MKAGNGLISDTAQYNFAAHHHMLLPYGPVFPANALRSSARRATPAMKVVP